MKNDCGTRLQKLTEDHGFTKPCQLADAISNLIASHIPQDYDFDIEGDKKRLQSELSKIFQGKKNPGLEIILEIIEVLANQNHTYFPLLVAKKIIDIYHDKLNARHVSLILNHYNDDDNEDIMDLSELSKIDQDWFNYNYFIVKDCGGLDWNDCHRKHPKLDNSIKDILKLLSDCIKNDNFQHFKEIYQNIENFLQLYGYRPQRLWLSSKLDSMAQQRDDIETSIQARASHTWSLVTDRKLDLAKAILSKSLEQFKYLNKYDKKTNFAKIIAFENLSRIAIIEKEFDLAKHWFNNQLKEIEFSKKLNIDLRHRTRYAIPVDYHAGRIEFCKEDYHNALKFFDRAKQDAKKIRWTRMQVCAQNWIAKIHIVQDQLSTAETLLREGLEIADKIRSIGRLGFYHQDLAILYKKREDKEGISLEKDYKEHYYKACGIFHDLGMDDAIKNLKQLIEINNT